MSLSNTFQPLPMPGMDSSNPLAYLATLGVLRLLSHARPAWEPRLGWNPKTQRPLLTFSTIVSQGDVVDALYEALVGGTRDPATALVARQLLADRQAQSEQTERDLKKDKKLSKEEVKKRMSIIETELSELQHRWLAIAAPHLNFGPDTKFSADDYRRWELDAARECQESAAHAEVVSALCSSSCVDEEGLAEDTAFRTVRGAGHQHFLGFMVAQLLALTPDHLYKTLFAAWMYDDPTEAFSLRWDPADDVRYALRWGNPSGDPQRKKRGGMIAASALAAAGLPMYPVMPQLFGLRTTGFSKINRATVWTWPLWEGQLGILTIRGVLALADLQSTKPNRRSLAARGIFEVYRSERFTQGKFRNFTPAEAV